MDIMTTCAIRRADVFIAEDNEVRVGSEQKGKRPVVILQNNDGNYCSPTTIVAYLTSQPKTHGHDVHVQLEDDCGLSNSKNSIVLLEQIGTIDCSRLTKRVGTLSQRDMTKVEQALKVSLALD